MKKNKFKKMLCCWRCRIFLAVLNLNIGKSYSQLFSASGGAALLINMLRQLAHKAPFPRGSAGISLRWSVLLLLDWCWRFHVNHLRHGANGHRSDSKSGLLQRGPSLCTWDVHSTNWATLAPLVFLWFPSSEHTDLIKVKNHVSGVPL